MLSKYKFNYKSITGDKYAMKFCFDVSKIKKLVPQDMQEKVNISHDWHNDSTRHLMVQKFLSFGTKALNNIQRKSGVEIFLKFMYTTVHIRTFTQQFIMCAICY